MFNEYVLINEFAKMCIFNCIFFIKKILCLDIIFIKVNKAKYCFILR